MARLSLDDFVDDPVVQRFIRRHEKVSVAILLDLLDGLIGVLRDELGEHFFRVPIVVVVSEES